MKLRLNSELISSSANGPGNRYVIWTQGCEFNCNGCFNSETHNQYDGFEIDTDELFDNIVLNKNIEGISISGGEPFLQEEAVNELLIKIKGNTTLSTLVFTGYTYNEIKADKNKAKLLNNIDILISGRYEISSPFDHPLLSSTNQEMIFLTDRYSIKDISNISCEIIIDDKGNIIMSGIKPVTHH